MSILAFDTHKAVTALKDAGFAEGQAEAVVNTVGEALGGNVVTKTDLTEVRTALEADLTEVRTALEADLTEVRTALEADLTEVRTALEADLTEVRAALETNMAAVRAEMAQEFKALYKHLWVMAVGIVGLTVTLMKLLP